jgi:hypothetical protein
MKVAGSSRSRIRKAGVQIVLSRVQTQKPGSDRLPCCREKGGKKRREGGDFGPVSRVTVLGSAYSCVLKSVRVMAKPLKEHVYEAQFPAGVGSTEHGPWHMVDRRKHDPLPICVRVPTVNGITPVGRRQVCAHGRNHV